MHNHYHAVLFMDRVRALNWSAEEEAKRWLTLCPPRMAINESADAPEQANSFLGFVKELSCDEEKTELYRERLCDLSWLMRFLNEFIARKANKEDKVKGRFWESRFKTQALLDEGAVLACMAYVDLNPVRAGIAETPETSEYTSIKERIKVGSIEEKQLRPICVDKKETLSPQTDNITSISLKYYLNLVDWTGRQIRHGKTGSIPAHLEPILCRLNLNTDNWIDTAQHFGNRFGIAAGHWQKIKNKAMETGQHWLCGMGVSRRVYQAVVD